MLRILYIHFLHCSSFLLVAMAVKTWFSLLALAMVVAQLIGTGMAYERPPARKMYIVLDDDDQDPTHPEQVSILLFLPEFFFVLLSDSLRSGGVLGCEGECLAVRKRGLGGLGLDGLTLRLAASWVLGWIKFIFSWTSLLFGIEIWGGNSNFYWRENSLKCCYKFRIAHRWVCMDDVSKFKGGTI